jgi:hypothetical protein
MDRKSRPLAPATAAEVRMVLARAKLTGAEAKKIRAVAELIMAVTTLLGLLLYYVC